MRHRVHMDETRSQAVDVVVVGGGPAGLAAALVLARSRRSVAVVDGGEARNAGATGVHNYVGREGISPQDLAGLGRAEVTAYGGRVIDGHVVQATAGAGTTPSFDVILTDGSRLTARRLILATGVVDVLPDLPGLRERWGRDVLHCPYCHGWEVRDRRIGVLAAGQLSLHQVGLFRQLTEHVTYFAHGSAPDHGELEMLQARNIAVVDEPVVELLVESDALVGVRLADGATVPLDALVVASRADARTDLAAGLGVPTHVVEVAGTVIGTVLVADELGATAVPGVHVAGNAAVLHATVVASAASGTQVGALVNADLVQEDTSAAVAASRATMREPAAWDERYGSTDAVWSGRVNPQLPRLVADLPPGRAVDVGCGEGGDVVWLAQHGWHATGVDFSTTGLDRARAAAQDAGVGDRTVWQQADARTWEPTETWDLVAAHYLHLPPEPMRELVTRLGAAVAPGGTLLVVGHHPDDVPQGHHQRDDLFTPDDLLPALDPREWDVTTEVVGRTHTGHGADLVVRDSILLARRLPAPTMR